MYTANLISPPTKDGAFVSVTVQYSDDTTGSTFQDVYRVDIFTAAWLKDMVRNKLTALNATPESVPTGPIDTSVPAPVVDAAKQAWLADDAQYWNLKRYVDDGILTSANTAAWTSWTNLVSRRKANFKPAYLA